MTALQLKQLLADAPDDMIVYVGGVTELGMFAFQEARIGESGIMELGPAEEGERNMEEGGKIFALMPHGLTVPEDEMDEEDGQLPPEVLN